MIAGAGGPDPAGHAPGCFGTPGIAEVVPVARPVEPECLGRLEAADRFRHVEEDQRPAQALPFAPGQADAGPGQEEDELAAVLCELTAVLGSQPPPIRIILAGFPTRAVVKGQRLLANSDPLPEVVLVP